MQGKRRGGGQGTQLCAGPGVFTLSGLTWVGRPQHVFCNSDFPQLWRKNRTKKQNKKTNKNLKAEVSLLDFSPDFSASGLLRRSIILHVGKPAPEGSV